MLNVVIDNCYSYFHNYDLYPKSVKQAIMDVASYFDKNAQRSIAFRQGKWDGRYYLVTSKGRIPTGIVPMAINAVARTNHQVNIIDNRKKPVPTRSYDWIGFQLRDYQEEARDKFIDAGRGIIEIPTRAGKTAIAGSIIQKLGVKVLYLVEGKESLYQTQSDLQSYIGNCSIGLFGDGNKQVKEVTIALPQALAKLTTKQIKQLFGDVDFLILDEVHKAGAKTIYQFSMHIDAYYRMGMSGTVFREDNKDIKMRALTGKILMRIESEEMWDKGFTMKPVVRWVDHKAPKLNMAMLYHVAYDAGIVMNLARNQAICDIVASHPDEQILISVEILPHGRILTEMLQQVGAKFIHGEMARKERKALFEDFKVGKQRVVVATRVLNASVTLPLLSVLINAAGKKSGVELFQKYGRVQGLGDKDKVYIYDFVDKHHRYLFKHAVQRMKKLASRKYDQEGTELFK